MKTKANSSFFSFRGSRHGFSPVSSGIWIAAFLLLISGIAPTTDASTTRDLRKYGFNGRFTGVVTGNKSFRTGGSGSFTVVPVSQLISESVPQPTRRTVRGYFGSDTSYSLYVRISVNRYRAVIRGMYFGEKLNPTLGTTTIRTGSRTLTVTKNRRMALVDSMKEYNSTGDLLGQWNLKGTLYK